MKEAAFSKIAEGVFSRGCVHFDRSWGIFALLAMLLLSQISAAQAKAIPKEEQPAGNPHQNESMCSACHTSNSGGRGTLLFGNDISQLCQSCHDGRQATREVHPVNLVPSAAIARRIPSDFPLEQGKLTCCTCHNITWSCPEKRPADMPNSDFLRGAPTPHALTFCFNCHTLENYQPYNVHDQLDAGKVKTDTCLWCHLSAPEVGSDIRQAASYGLRGKALDLCRNCHSVPTGHPTGNPHMYAKPSAEMMSYMSAYEIQHKMNLPLKQLIEYVQAARRAPRLIPLDENGGITCYSCHNPHEEGLLPNGNPRSVGAEPNKAKNHRLRIHQGDIACRACHQK